MEQMADIARLHAVQTSPLFGTSKSDGHFTTEQRPFCWQVKYFSTAHQRPGHTGMWRFCEGCFCLLLFFHGESALPPPPGKTWLHHQKSVESPWGILSLFTTRFRFSSEFTLPTVVMTQTCGVFVKQVVFLTVNHRGPLPLRELHSTDETWVWRDPREPWACLRPVSDYKWIGLARGCDTDTYVAALWSRSFFLRCITANPSPWGNFTPPTKLECGETLGDLEPVYDPFPISSELNCQCDTDMYEASLETRARREDQDFLRWIIAEPSRQQVNVCCNLISFSFLFTVIVHLGPDASSSASIPWPRGSLGHHRWFCNQFDRSIVVLRVWWRDWYAVAFFLFFFLLLLLKSALSKRQDAIKKRPKSINHSINFEEKVVG